MVDHVLGQVKQTPIGVPMVPEGWTDMALALGIIDGYDDHLEAVTGHNGTAVGCVGIVSGDIRNDPRWPDFVRWANEHFGLNIPAPEPGPVEPLPPAGWVHVVAAIEAAWAEDIIDDEPEPPTP